MRPEDLPKHVDLPDGGRRTIYNGGMVTYRDSRGDFHRFDGPAFIRPDGTCSFYIHGRKFKDEMHYRVHLANMKEEK
jgi:hypothetical protein